MALTAPSFTINFNLITGKFTIVDTTDYSGEGISTGDVTGALVIDGPSGNIYDGAFTPGSTNSSIDLELDSDGNVVEGDYTFTYTIVVGGAVQAGTYSKVTEIEYDFTLPVIDKDSITTRVDCTCGKLYSTDETDYGDVASTADYEHRIKYPEAAREDDGTHTPDEEETTLAVIVRPIYPGTFTTVITTTKTFTDDGYTVTAELTGSKETKVACANLCDFSCAISDLWTQVQDACRTDKREYNELLEKYLKAIGLVAQYGLLAERCGNDTKMASIRADLVTLLGDCECDCDDCNDEDGWNWGVCGSITETGSGNEEGGSGGSSSGTVMGTGILSIVDNGDGTITVNLTNGDSYNVSIPSGANGDPGEDGEDGASLRAYSFTTASTSSVSFQDLSSGGVTIPAGRFETNGDGFDIECIFTYTEVSGTPGGTGQINVNDGSNPVSTLVAPSLTTGINAVIVKIRALRTNTTELKFKVEYWFGLQSGTSFLPSQHLIEPVATAASPVDFTKAIDIQILGKVNGALNSFNRTYYTVTEINKI